MRRAPGQSGARASVLTVFAATALALAAIVSPAPIGARLAYAQTDAGGDNAAAGPSVLIVSMDRIFKESSVAVAIQEKAAGVRSIVRAQFSAREEALRSEEKELADLRESLDAESFKLRVAAFKEKVRELRRETSETGARLQRAVIEANSELKRALQPILLQIMAERRALVMLDEKDVVMSATVLDVTQEAIKRLDASAPNIEAPWPSGTSE